MQHYFSKISNNVMGRVNVEIENGQYLGNGLTDINPQFII